MITPCESHAGGFCKTVLERPTKKMQVVVLTFLRAVRLYGVAETQTLRTRKNMTALNWEASKRSTKRSDYSGDDLPRTGSWADQKRYGSLPFRSTHKAYAPSCAVIQSRASDFQKLHLYASHATSPDFRRKSVAMQREIVGIVTRLHVQCLSWAGAQSPMEVAAMKMAIAVMKNQIGSA